MDMEDSRACKVYAFQLGTRLRESSFFQLFTDPGKEILISYYFWGVQGPEEFVLVDCGFSSRSMEKVKADIKDFQPPEKLLNTLGIDPSEIKKVLLTHLHWDHCSSFDLFKNAVFYIQEKELKTFSGFFAKYPVVRQFIDPDAVLGLIRLNYQGRLIVLDGPAQVVPGIEVIPMGGHTPGSQVVRVRVAGGEVLLAGDVVPFYRNLKEGIPTGLYWDLREVLRAHQKIGQMIKPPGFFVPGHDPSVASMFTCRQGVITIA